MTHCEHFLHSIFVISPLNNKLTVTWQIFVVILNLSHWILLVHGRKEMDRDRLATASSRLNRSLNQLNGLPVIILPDIRLLDELRLLDNSHFIPQMRPIPNDDTIRIEYTFLFRIYVLARLIFELQE